MYLFCMARIDICVLCWFCYCYQNQKRVYFTDVYLETNDCKLLLLFEGSV